MNKYIEGALFNGSISYIYLMNGGKVDVRSSSLEDVDIGNEKIKDFNRINFEIDKDSFIRFRRKCHNCKHIIFMIKY